MSTRGTVIFMENELENMERLDMNDFKNTQSIYIHSDMCYTEQKGWYYEDYFR